MTNATVLRIAHREYEVRYGFPCEDTREKQFQMLVHEVSEAVRDRSRYRARLRRRDLRDARVGDPESAQRGAAPQAVGTRIATNGTHDLHRP